MAITDICIKRPVFATVINFLIILIGFMCLSKMSVREYPNIEQPVISVETTYIGANADVIEREITTIIEEALSNLPGVDIITSKSSYGMSNITLIFNLDRKLDAAAGDVRDKISTILNKLPKDANSPIISKSNKNAQAIMYLAASSDNMSPVDITSYIEDNVKDNLEMIEGVGSVNLLAAREKSVRIWLNADKMSALNVKIEDVTNAIKNNNLELPSGKIEGLRREFLVISKMGFEKIEDFRNLPVKIIKDKIIKLEDIANVEIGASNENTIVRYNKKESIALSIIPQSDANPLVVADNLRKYISEIQNQLPKDFKLEIAYDVSIFIKGSIKAVYHTIAEAVILVIIITYLFLGNFRFTIIPIVAIPVSIIGGTSLMYLAGFSINTLSLLAIVLAIGLVVDDAIVVLENIYRYKEEGRDAQEAARFGASEIIFPVIAMTLTLSAVFIPIGFMEGTIGKLFTEFAWTLAFCVLISGLAALTLTPMLCSKVMKKEMRPSKLSSKFSLFLDNIINKYTYKLEEIIRKPRKIIIISLIIAFMGGITFIILPYELSPEEDSAALFGVFLGKKSDSLEKTNESSLIIQDKILQNENVEKLFMIVGTESSANGFMFIGLKDWSVRSIPQKIVGYTLMPDLMSVPNMLAFVFSPPAFDGSGGGFGKAFNISLLSNFPYEKLSKISKEFVRNMQETGIFTDIEENLKFDTQAINIYIDQNKLALFGLNAAIIQQNLSNLFAASEVDSFKEGSKRYSIIMQLPRSHRSSLKDLERIMIINNQGKYIPLSNIANFKEEVISASFDHYNKKREAGISANLARNVDLGKAVKQVQEIADNMLDKRDVQLQLRGQAREFAKGGKSIFLTFLLAILFIYLVLAAQFESFTDPLIILFSVPLSVAGGLFFLELFGSSLNIYSQIGIVSLIGLITKNAILIVEFSNQLILKGEEKVSAIVKAASLRIRPILMTTCATIMGAVPLAFASGPGAEARNAIGLVIIGGLSLGTLFTLFIIPVVINIFKRNLRAEN